MYLENPSYDEIQYIIDNPGKYKIINNTDFVIINDKESNKVLYSFGFPNTTILIDYKNRIVWYSIINCDNLSDSIDRVKTDEYDEDTFDWRMPKNLLKFQFCLRSIMTFCHIYSIHTTSLKQMVENNSIDNNKKKQMNLYLVSRDNWKNIGVNPITIDKYLCVANSEDEARKLSPFPKSAKFHEHFHSNFGGYTPVTENKNTSRHEFYFKYNELLNTWEPYAFEDCLLPIDEPTPLLKNHSAENQIYKFSMYDINNYWVTTPEESTAVKLGICTIENIKEPTVLEIIHGVE